MSSLPNDAFCPPPRDQDEKKIECVCTYNKDMGKLHVTEKYAQFRSLHYDLKIPLSDVTSIKKKGTQKITLRTANDALYTFGPFDDIRRGSVFEALRSSLESKEAPKETEAGGIDMKAIPGLNDNIVQEFFQTTFSDVPTGAFLPPDDKDTVCIDESFSIGLKPLFALLFSDSSKFLEELHTAEGDIELSLNPWAMDESKAFYSRLFDFRKKSRLVNALVHQTQLIRLHSPTELWVETSNKMEGVPFSENFTVDTKWRITEEAGKCRIRVWVKVNFTKSVSLVKSKIERNSIQGTVDYFKAYANLLRSKFGGKQDNTGVQPAGPKPVRTDDKIGLSTIIAITLGLACALFFILWLWYWWSARSWSVYVSELEARNLELEFKIEELVQKTNQQIQSEFLASSPLNFPPEFLDKNHWQTILQAAETIVSFAKQMDNLELKVNKT